MGIGRLLGDRGKDEGEVQPYLTSTLFPQASAVTSAYFST